MSILSIELFKIFNRKRSYIGFVAVLVMVLLVLLAFYYEGKDMFSFITLNLENTFILQGNIVNGNMFAYIVLKSLWVHFPILVALVTGDLVSGEEQSGTLRIVLSRPVSRASLITAKFVSAIIYVSSLVVFMAVLSIGLGYFVFGNGDLLVLMNTVNIFPANDVLWRMVSAYLYGIVSMSTIAALSIFLSAITKNSLAAILGTIAIVIVLTLLSLINIPVLNHLKPLLFTTYSSSWQSFFEFGQSKMEILKDVSVLVLNIFGFYLATVIYFNKKDILS
jgi:ABC-2 type transport system permease protein